MTIAAAAMVLLIGVGVVSAALFTGSACGDLGPERLEAAAAGNDVPEAVRQAFGELDDDERAVVLDGISSVAEVLGPVVGAADVGSADRVGPFGSGLAAFGARTTALTPDGDEILATVASDDPAVLVGDGDTVYAVALVNDVTGQVDAIQPLDSSLTTVGTCVDAASVNVPFAFLLDAGGDELLLFRSDEDAGDPELELRGSQGSSWTVELDVPVAPPGLLGERISARLGDDVVVAARRVVPGEAEAAVVAVERGDGTPRWTLAPDDLPLPSDEPAWVEVLGMSSDVVVLAVAADDDRAVRTLVGLHVDSGAIAWQDGAPSEHVEVVVDDRHVRALVDDGSGTVLRMVDPATGERGAATSVAAERLRSVVLDDGRAIAALGPGGLVVTTSSGERAVDVGVPVLDILLGDEGRVTLLLGHDTGAMTVTFGA